MKALAFFIGLFAVAFQLEGVTYTTPNYSNPNYTTPNTAPTPPLTPGVKINYPAGSLNSSTSSPYAQPNEIPKQTRQTGMQRPSVYQKQNVQDRSNVPPTSPGDEIADRGLVNDWIESRQPSYAQNVNTTYFERNWAQPYAEYSQSQQGYGQNYAQPNSNYYQPRYNVLDENNTSYPSNYQYNMGR